MELWERLGKGLLTAPIIKQAVWKTFITTRRDVQSPVMSHVQIDRQRTWKLTWTSRWIAQITISFRLLGLKPLIININGL